MTPGLVATELIIWLNAHKILWPGYTTLQELVRRVLSDERQRLGCILTERCDDAIVVELDRLTERGDILSPLAVLKQDARDFGWRQRVHERETSKIGRLLSLYVDDSVPDPTTFGEARRRACTNEALNAEI